MRFRPHPSNAWLALAGAALFSSAAVACVPECSELQTIRYEEGITDPAGTVYQTTLVTGPYLHFPPNRKYELLHRLRADPVTVDIHLSFDEFGNLSPSAGNQSIWDVDKTKGLIIVRNDTCAEFYIYVVALAGPTDEADAGDAGSD